MNIGINLYSKWPYKEVISAFLENDIHRTFVCIEHPQFDEVMKALEKTKIIVENFHAPFKSHNDIWLQGEAGDIILERLCNAIECCVKYNVKVMVAHVSNGRPMPEITQVGLERFDRLMEYAKKEGVTVAFESHRYLENVKFIMERYPEAGFCLDNCHENAFTPGVRYMPMWGDRLIATHISDNEFVCDKDMHMLPFDGNIDFNETARELAQCGRDVTLMLEVKPDNHERYKGMSVREYYTEATKKLKQLDKMIDSYKNTYCLFL
ncbi:MAG: sugar phosphate isomerase/epimerase [Clostridia bacterium]|nr:sugar phosphate isomerase/epimerase [Clostridia bacterium]